MTGPELAGRVVLVTGASSGIGAAAARELHRRGATVHVAGRSPDRTAAVAADLGTEPIVADFARLADVREVAAQVLGRCDRLDTLVNNAGIWATRRQETQDGHELMFQVNHLAPFLPAPNTASSSASAWPRPPTCTPGAGILPRPCLRVIPAGTPSSARTSPTRRGATRGYTPIRAATAGTCW